jgi:hypothetical protein
MTRTLNKVILALFITSLSSGLHAQDQTKLTAHRVADKFEKLDLSSLPSWNKDEYKKLFREIRDKKFLSYEGEKRRIPWLFVRDGCHMRATHFIEEAVRLGHEEPKKVFVFGSLEMKGNIIPHGSVEPWFHAAPIVQVDGEAMVLDPSVSFSRPLSLKTWADRIVKDKNKVIYSICDSETYLPTSNCTKPKPLDRVRLNQETQLFLKFEKNILKYIGLGFLE